ncbi:hypothetical protein [Streptomyces spinosisporus]|jgi:hypothetical protein|uniref:Uncharacterized protein n=1 Tax=Streptomyces spinosisporus TaxID=2927582 RepID=A0ABS9X8E2_9ACTN|nr:hypothetical protein [Streptomyces spinosisporus]MCI3238210.1 hypothetical protein [Streptomyces spinosisporus]
MSTKRDDGHTHTACACTWSGSALVRPCLVHYGELSQIDQRRVRAGLAIKLVGDKRRQS